MIKITAYDFFHLRGQEGSVEQISADTIENHKGESFYKVKRAPRHRPSSTAAKSCPSFRA
jgi:hypothetical protein